MARKLRRERDDYTSVCRQDTTMSAAKKPESLTSASRARRATATTAKDTAMATATATVTATDTAMATTPTTTTTQDVHKSVAPASTTSPTDVAASAATSATTAASATEATSATATATATAATSAAATTVLDETDDFCALIDLRTGMPSVRFESSKYVADRSTFANGTMMRPYVLFWQDTSLFSQWMGNWFTVTGEKAATVKKTHTMYNKSRAAVDDTVPGVRRVYVCLYTQAIAQPNAQIFVSELIAHICRYYYDFDFKGRPVSVSDICKIVRYIQQVHSDYLNFFAFPDGEVRRRLNTAIVLGTKQFPYTLSDEQRTRFGITDADARHIFKCGFHVVFPFLYGTMAQRQQMTVNVTNTLHTHVSCKDFLEGWDSIVDAGVQQTGLRMLGSRRLHPCPNGCKEPNTSKRRRTTGGLTMPAPAPVPTTAKYTRDNDGNGRSPSPSLSSNTTAHMDTNSLTGAGADTNPDTARYARAAEEVCTAADTSGGRGDGGLATNPVRHVGRVADKELLSTKDGDNDNDDDNASTTVTATYTTSAYNNAPDPQKDPSHDSETCRYCHGQGKCCEDRSYVPLCVLDGGGQRDPAFELSLLDLRRAVDWTMIRAPSLIYDPTQERIRPRTDVDASVVHDQLYGIFRDAEKEASVLASQAYSTSVSVTDAYQFLLHRERLRASDIKKLFSFTHMPLPAHLYGRDGITIPQWHNWSNMVPAAPANGDVRTNGIAFCGVNTKVYPEAFDLPTKGHAYIRMQQYDAERTAMDYKHTQTIEKSSRYVRLTHRDERFDHLEELVQRSNPMYSRVRARAIFQELRTTDPVVYLVPVVGTNSRYCFHKGGSHNSNHIRFSVQVYPNPNHPCVRVIQECYSPKVPENATKPCCKLPGNAFRLTDVRRETIELLHPPLPVRASASASTQAQTQTQTHTTQALQVRAATASGGTFPSPPAVHEQPFLSDATVFSVTYQEHMKQQHRHQARGRLEKLWRELCSKHNDEFRTMQGVPRMVLKVLRAWWKAARTQPEWRTKLDQRDVSPDDVCKSIRQDLLNKQIFGKTKFKQELAGAGGITKKNEEDFKYYIQLFCLWVPSHDVFAALFPAHAPPSKDLSLPPLQLGVDTAIASCMSGPTSKSKSKSKSRRSHADTDTVTTTLTHESSYESVMSASQSQSQAGTPPPTTTDMRVALRAVMSSEDRIETQTQA